MKTKLFTTFALCLIFQSGCGNDLPEPDKLVSLESIPKNLMEIATKELPGVKFYEAFEMKFDGKSGYEIRGKDNRGRVREIELTTEGEIMEIE